MATTAGLAQRVMTATDLETLLDAWREHGTACHALEESDEETLDSTALPTFGGETPASTAEVWSWDATRLLVGTCPSDAQIVMRRHHGTCPDCGVEGDECCIECGCCRECGPCHCEEA